ncbi:MAG: sugar O-acetyltransferase [Lachnospiraceae bacterium]|nr:sugar O-acetyltransferase [Lachnospiraceae bacterium]
MDIMELTKSSERYCIHDKDMPKDMQERAGLLCHRLNQLSPTEHMKRAALLKQLLGSCDEKTFIKSPFQCDYGYNVHTHGLTVVNANCVFLDTSPIEIGANAFIGPNTVLTCVAHSIDPVQRGEGVLISAPITIEEDVWIGANVTVCGGVTIGRGSVIGAGSVVTEDIPAGVVAAGSPCHPVRQVTEEDKVNVIQ